MVEVEYLFARTASPIVRYRLRQYTDEGRLSRVHIAYHCHPRIVFWPGSHARVHRVELALKIFSFLYLVNLVLNLLLCLINLLCF